MEPQSVIHSIIIQPWAWPFLLYLGLQLFLLWRTRRTRFIWPTLIPIPFAIYLVQDIGEADRAGDDLWLLSLALWGAVMALYLGYIALRFLFSGPGRRG
jgi:hypothetical protein